MQKSKIITFLIIIVVIFLAVFLFLAGNKKTVLVPVNDVVDNTVVPVNTNPTTSTTTTNPTNNTITIKNVDLVSFSIAPISQVSGVMNVTGTVKNGYFFEGNIILNILDSNKNLLKTGHGTATIDWMTSGPVSFDATLDFTGLPTGPGYIQIHNDNASGLPEYDKSILIPVIIN